MVKLKVIVKVESPYIKEDSDNNFETDTSVSNLSVFLWNFCCDTFSYKYASSYYFKIDINKGTKNFYLIHKQKKTAFHKVQYRQDKERYLCVYIGTVVIQERRDMYRQYFFINTMSEIH